MRKSFVSLEKGLDILCSFDFDHQELSAQEISKKLHIPLSSTYKYLDLLSKKGFLAKHPDTKKYFLGLTIFRMGNIFVNGLKLVDVAIPHMKSLSEMSGETVLLTVINGLKAMCIEKIETSRLIKLSLERGSRRPLNAAASSKILLAYQDNSFIDAMLENGNLTGLTEHTITDPDQLRKELKIIREQGFAFSDSEADLGAKAVAAPVLDHKGRVAAGLTIAGPGERINSENIPKLTALVKDSAREISYDLGYREGV